MADTPEPQVLRKVTLLGPSIGRGKTLRPLWTLSAAAPHFGRQHAFGKDGKPSGVVADHVHPLRVLTADMSAQAEWRQPRLLGVHLVIGATATHYVETGDPERPRDAVMVALTPRSKPVEAEAGRVMRTLPEVGDEQPQAPFVQVVAEPLAQSPWPTPHGTDIRVPPLRLVAGRVGLRLLLADKRGKDTGLGWLEGLHIRSEPSANVERPLRGFLRSREATGSGKEKWATIWLVPDGIEFDALLSLPGHAGQLPGRVLLAAGSDDDKASDEAGSLYLTLLRPTKGAEADWLNAWGEIVPRGNEDDALLGLKFSARRNQVPAFRWPVLVDNAVRLGDSVQIPHTDLRVALVSPTVRGIVDGVAELRTGWIGAKVATGNKIEFTFPASKTSTEVADPARSLTFSCERTKMGLAMAKGQAVTLGVDAMRLAADLRAAYGIDEPPSVPAMMPGTSAGAAFARPLIPAFVPLDEGWLQLPIPNLGRLDTSRDVNLVAGPAPPSASAIAEGYFRAKRIAPPPTVMTGYADGAPKEERETPWSLTIERAAKLKGVVTVSPRSGPGDPGPDTSSGRLDQAMVWLQDCVLSWRGLIWLSGDRPDALEAIPRLGAGPGAVLDVALESGAGDDILAATLTQFSISASSSAPVALEHAELRLDFNADAQRWKGEILAPYEAQAALAEAGCLIEGKTFPKSSGGSGGTGNPSWPWPAVLWRRHPYIPLAAEMPMTRSAAGAVRPLESRDLIPFCVLPKRVKPSVPLAVLRRQQGQALATLRLADFQLKRVAAWRWEDGAPEDGSPERGIAFAALGMPGVEVRPVAAAASSASELKFEAAVRYDLPALDEAFATAPLPPTAEPPASGPGQDPAEVAGPVATALDWPSLAALWKDQDRKHQNARVVDSYLASFAPVDTLNKTKVRTLIHGLVWQPEIAVETTKEGPLPYGTLAIAGKGYSGNAALKGYCGPFKANPTAKTLTPVEPGDGNVEVLGFSPSTFKTEPGGFDLDNRLLGAKAPTRQGKTLVRAITFPKAAADSRLVSLLDPIEVRIGAQVDGKLRQQGLLFWFKDVLFEGGTAKLGGADGIDLDVWDQEDKLARSGLEWRLAPTNGDDTDAALRLGRDEISLFGFRLEPLRLTFLSMSGDAVSAAKILCRLSLGDREVAPDPGANLITLSLAPGASGEPYKAAFDSPRLRFAFVVREEVPGRGALTRRAEFVATPAPGPEFALAGTSFQVEIAGVPIELGAPTITLSANGERDSVNVEARPKLHAPAAGKGRLTVASAVLTAGLHIVKTNDQGVLQPFRSSLALTRVVAIAAQADGAAASTPVIYCQHSSISISAMDADGDGLSLFGCKVSGPAEPIMEGEGVVSVSLKGGTLPGGWSVSFALLARLKVTERVDGFIELDCGYAEGQLLQGKCDWQALGLIADVEVKEGCFGFMLSAADSGQLWSGTASVSGLLKAQNAIRWPALGWKVRDVPVPGKPKTENSGRIVIEAAGGEAATHTITWILAQHRLPIAVAASLAEANPAAIWATPVTARHQLARDGKTIRWTGVETIAIGAPRAIIPAFDGTDDAYRTDATTFAARYRDKIKGTPEQGMHRPGLGAVATVLQGALGAAFRKAFKPPTAGLILAGGFVGTVTLADTEAAPLVRVPVLVGLGTPVGQTGMGSGIEMAWNDTAAARLLAVTRGGAGSPANASLDALRAAMLAGSRPARLKEDEWLSDPVGALLVEQSFVNADLTAGADLATTPFFLAAAVSVERLWKSLPANGAPTNSATLALVAGRVPVKSQKRQPAIPLAAAIALRDAEPILPSEPAKPMLVIVGHRVSVLDWTGSAPLESGADDGTARLAMGLAIARDVDPRATLVVWPKKTSPRVHPARNYFARLLPAAVLKEQVWSLAQPPRFADLGRGSLAAPDASSALPWLAPAVEGAIRPIRDEADGKASDETRSGIAGLTRQIALPAHAGVAELIETGDAAGKPATPNLVWLAQHQVPVYLPLQTQQLNGPPIGWLTPAPPRVRLPSDDDVVQALRAAGGRKEADASTERKSQPFLPQKIGAASVGERAGVLTVRRTRLLSRLRGIASFDPASSRFGRPAQAGSSVARKMRTPRPGPLPKNTGDAQRDRRIQASSIRPDLPFAALIGSADIVQGPAQDKGQTHFPAWSIAVAAMPVSESLVSDQWDGTVRLACRVEIAATNDQDTALGPLAVLERALVRLAGDGSDRLAMSGLLKIGDVAIPFGRVVFDDRETIKWPADPVSVGATRVYACIVNVTLDPRTAQTRDSVPRVHPLVAAALSTPGQLPPVEVQWTVHPHSSRAPIGIKPGEDRPLTILTRGATRLSEGEERAPLTLRLPLYPVTTARGALPLTPATLLFADPAYDRDLAGPPTEDGRVLQLNATELPPARGDLRLVLAADRGRINRRGVVTFMLDVRHERPMDDLAQARTAGKVAPGGDLMNELQPDIADLRLMLQPKDKAPRPLRLGGGDNPNPIAPGKVYELPLAALCELDGSPARLAAGDILELQTALATGIIDGSKPTPVFLWNSKVGDRSEVSLSPPEKKEVACSVRLVLTDEAVVEPPPALYACLLRTKSDVREDAWRIAVPLHAQSPLPWRVDLETPALDFRKGMMRRRANFVWTLTRPRPQLDGSAIYVIKSDRNGQTYLPAGDQEFLPATDLRT